MSDLREQAHTLKWLETYARAFQTHAHEIWWHATNGYGRKERVERLQALRTDAERLIAHIDKAIEQQGEA